MTEDVSNLCMSKNDNKQENLTKEKRNTFAEKQETSP